MSGRTSAALTLQRMFARTQKEPSEYFSCGLINENDIFHWRVAIIGPEGTLYRDGIFPAQIDFPDDFPQSPPKMRFLCPMWHPNISEDGTVCISILHQPGNDPWDNEKASERWLPIHNIESIIVSVISLFTDPNPTSAFNVKANHDFLFDQAEYKKKVRRCARESINY